MKNTYVLLMAGGLGSRFWPKSRETFPKQFIDILGTGESLLQQTAKRFEGICSLNNLFVLTNSNYLDIIKEQLPNLPIANILLEPSRNNTAPCIAYACYKIFAKDSDANIVISPSDHIILKEETFKGKIKEALSFASHNDALITLGISPTRPDTGYGYIKLGNEKDGIYKVVNFLEKPAYETAKQYVASGDYVWNAGIFIWNVKSIIKAFNTHAPEISKIFSDGLSKYGTDEEVEFITTHYPKSPNISIDYAIMEKSDNVYTIPAEIGWSDLGTWASLYEVMDKDEFNVASNTKKIAMYESNDCIIHLPANKVALIKGLSDYVIVDDGTVLVIVPKADEQNIKGWSKEIIEKFGKEYC